MQSTRREFLGGAGAIALGSAAGCVDGFGGGADGRQDDVAYTAFFALEKFAEGVAGDALDAENPIPVGELGHQYEVGVQAQLDVARSRAFVYVDFQGFQRWAVDAADNLRANHPEVALVDAAADVDLLDTEGHEHAHDEGDSEGRHDEGDSEGRHDDGSNEGRHDGGGSDAEGDFDPHFWLDPVRAATCVETVRDGFVDADPSNADAHEANADAYLERLSDLEETFREELADRELDTVVVASHDSFQYLADRYDLSVHSPVGVSPNAEPGSAEITDTIDLVDERGIDVVLHDAFESPNLAETVVRESNAEEAMSLSPVAGTKPEWHDDGWGYVEQMKELNLPALKAALKAR